MTRQHRIIVVETDSDFDRAVHEHKVDVEFPNDRAEQKYERSDESLALRVQDLMVELFGGSNDGVLYHQNLDWWPNLTRFLEFDSVCITWHLIERLQSLLVGDFRDWRFNVHVYTPLGRDDSDHVGGLNVYCDWILVQRNVYEYLHRPPGAPDAPASGCRRHKRVV